MTRAAESCLALKMLRAQEHGHQPLVMGLQQEAEARVVIELFENHGIDARYTGPHKVSPTLTNRGGTGFSEPNEYDTELT